MAIIQETNVNLATHVRDVLNAAGGSVSNDVTTFFKAAAKLNHWSKYKPVRYPEDFPSMDEYWKASDGNCGFTPKSTSVYTEIPSYMDGEMNGWTYNLPRGKSGTINEPMRLGDFRGYDTDAVPMISNFFVPDRMSNQQTSAKFTATAMVASEGGTSVTLADLALGNYYAGVLVRDSSGTIKKIIIGSSLSGGTFTVEVPCYDITAGTYTCYPFISKNSAVGVSGQLFYTLPNVQAKSITIVTSNFVIAVLAERLTTGVQSISYKITITNTSTAATWTNNTYKLRFMGKKFEDALVTGEKSGTLKDTVEVAANTSIQITGFISDISNELWSESAMVLWVSFNNGAHITSGAITQNTQE